jgi:hypothetical protein
VCVDFSTFVSTYPDWETIFNVYTKDSSKYKRIICSWEEDCLDKKIMHEFHATINTTNGDIFLDCSRRKLFAKHIMLIIARPIHIAIKTLWHLSIFGPLTIQIFKLYKGQSSLKELTTHTFHSLSDIVRTPLYGLAMTVTYIAGIILGSFCPNSLYYTRDAAGWLERTLLRESKVFKTTPWALSPCFSPMYNLQSIAERHIIFLENDYKKHYEERDKKNIEESIKQFLESKHIKLSEEHHAVILKTCEDVRKKFYTAFLGEATEYIANRYINSMRRHKKHPRGVAYKSSVAL